jgi:hypothetical protein
VEVEINGGMGREREGFGRGGGADDVTGRNSRTGTGGDGDGDVDGDFEYAVDGMSEEAVIAQSSSIQNGYGYGFEDDGTSFSDAFLLDPEGFFGGEMWDTGAGGSIGI